MADTSGNANRVLAENLFAAIRQERIEDVEKYLCLGADPNYIVLNGHSPFHIAAGCKLSDQFINLMLQYDGDPNVRNNDGLTPLHIATSWGKVGSMKLLAENGADVFTMDNEARDLKWFAEENGSPECIRLAQTLLSGEQQSEADHRLYKENRNPNSSRYTSEDSRVLTPRREPFDDSWVAKNRGSSRRPRIASADKTPLNLRLRENDSATISEKNADRFASANNLTRSPRSPYVTAPRSAQRVLSPGRQFFCPDNFELDTTDKCVGTSVLSTRLGLDTTDKCVGSSILCATYEDTPTREDCFDEEEMAAAANKDRDCEVFKSVQTSCCEDEQLENLGPRAVTSRER